jgi:hypothetical protein
VSSKSTPSIFSKKIKPQKNLSQLSNLAAYRQRGYTVYALWCPLSKQIRYVGYTNATPWGRFHAHLAEARREPKGQLTDKCAWLRSLAELGLMPRLRVLRCFERKIPAYKMEAELIALVGARRSLTNSSKGSPNWKAHFTEQHAQDWRDAE